MATEKRQKKRNYYKTSKTSVDESRVKTFLLRYRDAQKDAILHEGPFSDEDAAKERLNSLLRNGVCSWLVSYNA
tara:strand:+ start:74 stop:295 length:222 start_codon:yes stop_codon:yes gene_type:complete